MPNVNPVIYVGAPDIPANMTARDWARANALEAIRATEAKKRHSPRSEKRATALAGLHASAMALSGSALVIAVGSVATSAFA